MENILKEFDILMNQATTVTDEFVEKYENYYQKIKKIRKCFWRLVKLVKVDFIKITEVK